MDLWKGWEKMLVLSAQFKDLLSIWTDYHILEGCCVSLKKRNTVGHY
jgi:hypothetical protein